MVSPVLEPERAVTHVAELDAQRDATADEVKEQDATLPLSREPDGIHVVEQCALQVQDVLPVSPCAIRDAGPDGILNGSPELDEIPFAGGTRVGEALPNAIGSAVVPWDEIPVAKAWPSIHLEVACPLVRFLMESVAIRYGSQAREIPWAKFDVFLSLSATRLLATNVVPEPFWLLLLSDSAFRCVLRRQLRPVWLSRVFAGVRRSPWHTRCDRRVPPAHAAFAPALVRCDARSSRFSPSPLDRAGYRPGHRCKPRDLSSQ